MSEAENLFEKIVDSKPETKKTKQSQSKEESKEDSVQELMSEIKKLKSELKSLKESSGYDPGNPANEWAKKLAKDNANKKAKPFKTIFTIKEGKVLKVDIKKNGSYSSYIGNAKKNKEQIAPLISQWKKQGVWVDEFEIEMKTKEIMDALED